MLEKIDGIVLEIIKHNDKHNVVVIYTRQHGRMSFLTPVGKSKSGKMRNAVLSLMAIVKAEVNIKAGKELYNLKNVQPEILWHNIYGNPIKCSLLFFLAEFCSKLVRQYPPDEKFWTYLINSLRVMDSLSPERLASFHIAFLIGLLSITGICPPVEKWEAGEQFDMLSGEMLPPDNQFFLRRTALISSQESRHIPVLLRMNYFNMHSFRYSRQQRQAVLDHLLTYYSIHLPIGKEMKTLPVLREFFD